MNSRLGFTPLPGGGSQSHNTMHGRLMRFISFDTLGHLEDGTSFCIDTWEYARLICKPSAQRDMESAFALI